MTYDATKSLYFRGDGPLVLSAMYLSFFADDEPVDIFFYVSSAREKQDYRRQWERIMSCTLTEM
jgi:hypothetical protein